MSDKLNLQSLNIPEEKREELLRIFPEVRTEGGQIDFDRLRLALGDMVDPGKERYGLNWPGKSACFKAIQTPSMGTLLPAPEESVNFDTTENLIIEGDNLEVLKLLQKSYIGKVKMIYIDPPYNTGNDFIYPDNYSESLQTYLDYTGQTGEEGKRFSSNTDTDGRFHSKWLNMMYPRLYLARDLLRDDGVIFISIDEVEHPSLRFVCDTIFGKENFIADMVWAAGRKNDSRLISISHEYILCYAKNAGYLSEKKTEWRQRKKGLEDIYSQYAKLKREYGQDYSAMAKALKDWFRQLPDGHPSKVHKHYNNIDSRGVYFPDNISWPGGGGPTYQVIHPITKKPVVVPSRGWMTSDQEKMKRWIAEDRVHFGPDESYVPCIKSYLKDREYQVPYSVFYQDGRAASKRLRQLMGNDCFPFPKDETVIQELIAMLGTQDGLVLDFFAGSGTTAHAVLDLNRQDGGNRKFILVQLPEPTDCTNYQTIAEITKERVRRVIKKLNDEDSNEKNQDRGFRVFKLAESNFTPWDSSIYQSPEALSRQMEMHIEHVRHGRTDEDILYEILLKSGFPLSIPVQTLQVDGKTVYSIHDGLMLVCLDRNLTMPLVQAIVDRLPERVVFLDEGFAGNDALKVNAKEACKLKNIVFKVV
ncbi:MAG: site-specific DNA-methyltransferase [Planctomycetia bacterium]|nr:site-specific DNA-methyltransferase [Planctomycetia bacterium]